MTDDEGLFSFSTVNYYFLNELELIFKENKEVLLNTEAVINY